MVCQKCRGTGAKNAKDVKKCTSCGGKGVKIVTHQVGPGFVQQMQQPCNKCGGKGKVVTSKCPVCNGQKVIHGTDDLLITIERGMADGQEIVFPRAGLQPSTTKEGGGREEEGGGGGGGGGMKKKKKRVKK